MSQPTIATVSPEIPSNLYKLQSPWTAKVLEVRRLTAEDSANDVEHIVLDLEGSDYRYLDGQSVGIIPPGKDAAGKPHKLRLYSIASAAIGDDRQGKTLSICVKRAITVDEATGVTYPGICSNYLCDLKVGDVVQATGPVGKAFLMPQALHPDLNGQPSLIMIATGTGIAPFRAFLDVAYRQAKIDNAEHWLFFGMQTQKDFLYQEELTQYAEAHAGFHLVTAISREQKTAAGERLYVQHRIAEHAQALIRHLQQPHTYVYICGLKGMEHGILTGLSQAAEQVGVSWEALYQQLQQEKRWHVEVY